MADLPFERVLARLQEALDNSGIIAEASMKATKMIRSRTVRGISMHGRQFASYADSTARRKGRFRPVTLHESGRFIKNHQPMKATGSWFKTRRGGVTPKGLRARKLSRFHMKGTRYMASRQYLGLTEKQENQLNEFIGNRVADVARKALDIDERIEIRISL